MFSAALLLSLLFYGAATAQDERGFRGIVPMHSTCEDVKRILGVKTCEPPDNTYDLGDERVKIEFTKQPCEKAYLKHWNVPPGTVVSILRMLKKPLRLKDFRPDVSKCKKSFTDEVNQTIYSCDEEGIGIWETGGKVYDIDYTPTPEDAYLLCPSPPEPPPAEPVGPPPSLFFSYSDLPFEKGQEHLESYAQAMKAYAPDSQGYIVVYAGRCTLKDEAQWYADLAKLYVVQNFDIDEDRIKAIDGGYREKLAVELYFGPRGSRAPDTSPTVQANEVQFIVGDRAKHNCRSPRPSHKKH